MLRKTMLLTVALGSALFGGGFWLTVGTPAAGAEAQANNAVLIIRPDGCHEPRKAKLNANAES
jgi:hypothetical protein